MRHIIWIYFDHDRPHYTPSEAWIRARHEIFHEFTLRSIHNQTDQDFEVFLICGQRNRDLTDSLAWDQRVQRIHDKGRALVSGAGDDFIALSRIDSDDLYHEDAFACIREEAEWEKDPRGLRSLVFRRNYLWDRVNDYIGRHNRLCQPPPFVTRIFPRFVYKRWKEFHRLTFVPHGNMTMKAILAPREISPKKRMVCVVKHGTNTHQVRQSRPPLEHPPASMKRIVDLGRVVTQDHGRMTEILAEFGVAAETVVSPLHWWSTEGETRRAARR